MRENGIEDSRSEIRDKQRGGPGISPAPPFSFPATATHQGRRLGQHTQLPVADENIRRVPNAIAVAVPSLEFLG